MDQLKAVTTFHEMASQPVNHEPTLPDIKAIRFRQHFLLEELMEGFAALCHENSPVAVTILENLHDAQKLCNELTEQDIDYDPVEFLDSLNDMQYVISGTALYYGLPIEEGFAEVHNKNMTRFPKDAKELEATLKKAKDMDIPVKFSFNTDYGRFAVIRLDNGKLFKNAHHQPPDLAYIIENVGKRNEINT